MFSGGNVAVGQEQGVGGMIVAGMKRPELGMRQIGDRFGIAAAVVIIGNGRKQPALQSVSQALHRRTERAFHLVEHHALEGQFRGRIIGRGEFQPVAFLGKIALIQQREKCGVQIHVQQVVKILFILAGEGISGPVAAGEGIHEGIERAPGHHEERVTHRVALTAA